MSACATAGTALCFLACREKARKLHAGIVFSTAVSIKKRQGSAVHIQATFKKR